ncbi:MAG: hypothetical protein ACTSP4_10575 [Candidatus Hodarchaeales archaeon]
MRKEISRLSRIPTTQEHTEEKKPNIELVTGSISESATEKVQSIKNRIRVFVNDTELKNKKISDSKLVNLAKKRTDDHFIDVIRLFDPRLKRDCISVAVGLSFFNIGNISAADLAEDYIEDLSNKQKIEELIQAGEFGQFIQRIRQRYRNEYRSADIQQTIRNEIDRIYNRIQEEYSGLILSIHTNILSDYKRIANQSRGKFPVLSPPFEDDFLKMFGRTGNVTIFLVERERSLEAYAEAVDCSNDSKKKLWNKYKAVFEAAKMDKDLFYKRAAGIGEKLSVIICEKLFIFQNSVTKEEYLEIIKIKLRPNKPRKLTRKQVRDLIRIKV